MTKTCRKCHTEKPLEDFYDQKSNRDGVASSCKECVKARMSEIRWSNIDEHRERDRKRYLVPKTREAHIKQAAEWRKMNSERARSIKAAWGRENSKKKNAHCIVKRKITEKGMKPELCQCCGANGVEIHGHHPDYSKPLEVIWLCTSCHGAEHRRLREEERKMKIEQNNNDGREESWVRA